VPVALVIGQLELGGGAERQLAELAVGLGGEGFNPVVISLRAGGAGQKPEEAFWAGHLRARGIRTREIRRAGNLDLSRLLPLISILREESPAIVHSFLFPANAYARVAGVLTGRRPILLASERSAGLPTGRIERLVDRCLLRLTDGIITNAEAVRRLLVARRTRVPIWVVPNGIDPSLYAPEGRASARAALGVGPEAPLVGTVARMSAEKNYPFLLRVLSQVRQVVPDVQMIAIGDGPLRSSIERQVRSLGLESVVRLLGRVENVADFLPALDVFVLTSDYEGLSNAIMEAQSSGVPCVVTDVGGNSEVVSEGRTGFLVPCGVEQLFADRVGALLSEPVLRRGMALEARRRVLATFSLDRMIAATAAVYRDLLKARAGKRSPVRGGWGATR
jgi:glycosyltransferase involved in cell wall biosynthesis